MANEQLIRKFAGFKAPEGRTRRFDYKGVRKRMNLRITEEIAINLQIIKLATGEDKNTYCERTLRDAIDSKLTELKSRHDPATWETFLKVARRERRP